MALSAFLLSQGRRISYRGTRCPLAAKAVTAGISASQCLEKLPQVSDQQFWLLPTGEVASSRHLRVVHQIEISRKHTFGRVQGRHLTGESSEASWYGYFASQVGSFINPAPVKPDGGSDRFS